MFGVVFFQQAEQQRHAFFAAISFPKRLRGVEAVERGRVAGPRYQGAYGIRLAGIIERRNPALQFRFFYRWVRQNDRFDRQLDIPPVGHPADNIFPNSVTKALLRKFGFGQAVFK